MVLDVPPPLVSAADLEGNLHLCLISPNQLEQPSLLSSNVEAAKFLSHAVLHTLKGFDCKQPVLPVKIMSKKTMSQIIIIIIGCDQKHSKQTDDVPEISVWK